MKTKTAVIYVLPYNYRKAAKYIEKIFLPSRFNTVERKYQPAIMTRSFRDFYTHGSSLGQWRLQT